MSGDGGSIPFLSTRLKFDSMKKVIITIVLALIAIAAIAWACTYSFSGLAWFPGFFVAICCGIKILDVNGIGQER